MSIWYFDPWKDSRSASSMTLMAGYEAFTSFRTRTRREGTAGRASPTGVSKLRASDPSPIKSTSSAVVLLQVIRSLAMEKTKRKKSEQPARWTHRTTELLVRLSLSRWELLAQC